MEKSLPIVYNYIHEVTSENLFLVSALIWSLTTSLALFAPELLAIYSSMQTLSDIMISD